MNNYGTVCVLSIQSIVEGGGGGRGGGAGKSKEEGGCQRGDFKPL